MVLQVSIRIRPVCCAVSRLPEGVSLSQVSGERGWDLFVLRADDAAQLDEQHDELRADWDQDLEVIARTPETLVFRGHNKADGTVAAIRRSGCTILWPSVARRGVEHFTLLAPSRANVRALIDDIGDRWPVEIDRIADVSEDTLGAPAPLADLAAGLTPRQLEILRAALAAGYYDAPRRMNLEDLGARLGISTSTLSEHLRKAERVVLERVGGLFDLYPGLVEAANRGPGRPTIRV